MSWKSEWAHAALCSALALSVVCGSGCTGMVDSGDVSGDDLRDADGAVLVDARVQNALEAGLDATTDPVFAGDGGAVNAALRDAQSAFDAATNTDAARADDSGAGSACASAQFLFCEDFESAADGQLPAGWTALNGWGGGTAPKVVSDVQHRGQRALETGVALNGQTRVQHSLSALGTAARKHWGRVFYRAKLPAPPPSSGVLHNTLVALRGADESRVVDTVISTSGAHQFLYNIPDDSFGKGSSYDYHTYDGAWHCAEWYVDSSLQSYRFFVDGSEVSSIAFTGEAKARLDTFTTVVVGFINYQTPSAPYDGWFDDLALNSARIGCD